ncbi:hypothetical protein GG496_002564 [Candidatus Fervidibacteria bacterium JGI MDM2 JNZ-1-D12]
MGRLALVLNTQWLSSHFRRAGLLPCRKTLRHARGMTSEIKRTTVNSQRATNLMHIRQLFGHNGIDAC